MTHEMGRVMTLNLALHERQAVTPCNSKDLYSFAWEFSS